MPFRHWHNVAPEIPYAGRRLNYLSAQCPFGTTLEEALEAADPKCLNYLSAQCPFGTIAAFADIEGDLSEVSITFRLSALSARVRGRPS